MLAKPLEEARIGSFDLIDDNTNCLINSIVIIQYDTVATDVRRWSIVVDTVILIIIHRIIIFITLFVSHSFF